MTAPSAPTTTPPYTALFSDLAFDPSATNSLDTHLAKL